MGLAVDLQNGIAHHFLANLFSHQSCVWVGTADDGSFTFNNDSDSACIFAWGRGGGSKKSRALASSASNGDDE